MSRMSCNRCQCQCEDQTQTVPDVQLPPMNFTQVYLRPYGQTVDWGYKYVEADHKLSHTRSGEDALVFILDTGIAPHVDLDANRRKEYDKNFTADSQVQHPHGTHCAGIVAAVDNQKGVIGVAPKAGLVDIQVLNGRGSGTYDGITKGILYVADLELKPEDKDKVKIISMSLGGGTPYPPMHEAIKYAISKGVVVVAAAGNSGYVPGQNRVAYPGRYQEVITVAALDPDNDNDPSNQKAANYSSAGPEVDIAAPGSKVLSTVMNDGYARFSGTSMACPHIAGICALLLTYRKDIPTEHVEGYLKEMAVDLMEKRHDVRTGFGAPIIRNYLRDEPEDPEDPDDPAPPPEEPDDKPFHKRKYVMPFQVKNSFQWRRKEGPFSEVDVEMVLKWKTNLKFEDAHDVIQKLATEYFEDRRYTFNHEMDLWRLRQAVRTRFRDYVREALAPELIGTGRVSLTDEQGRELK